MVPLFSSSLVLSSLQRAFFIAVGAGTGDGGSLKPEGMKERKR